MSRLAEVLPENLADHFAVQTWNHLRSGSAEPESLQIFKCKKKTAVYRLAGMGPEGSAVIAKRCCARTAEVERLIYQEMLPRLNLPALRCFDFKRESASDFSWLFLEEAVGSDYSPFDFAHRVMAGEWLGALHTAASELGPLPGLPNRDCHHYLHLLHSVENKIQMLLGNPAVPAADRPMLHTLTNYCELVETHWPALEDKCSGVPATIVHGDLAIKNVRVRSTPTCPALLVFDWENAGWGVPATDLAQFIGRTLSPDLATYTLAAAQGGVSLEFRAAERLAECGNFFRLLDDMAWACNAMMEDSYAYLLKPLSYLRSYGRRLDKLLRAAGWAA